MPNDVAFWVLIVLLKKERTKRWIARTSANLWRDNVHVWGTNNFNCACPECVSEFDYAFRWVRIR